MGLLERSIAIGLIALSSLSFSLSVSGVANADSNGELSNAISKHLMDVDEFHFIREEAEKLGVHAWLFGGTASGFGHYVHWNELRLHEDPRFQPDRFDFDYTNIYRSTQDLDIVIDGTAEQATELQQVLEQRYPHLQGSKTAWEVRLLNAPLGAKQALLDNPDYLNQHTDSNSTGMIEITRSKDPVVRDLKEWSSTHPQFLKDLQSGTLHYYFSELHDTTSRFREGLNPPILSVIRYLTKAFQYELKITPEDEKRVRQVIDVFDPHGFEMQNSYVSNWIEKNGKKLFQHAVNIEYAWNELERLGLRRKLIAIKNNPDETDSLSWWMNKEPLRSFPLGQGEGNTAEELAKEGKLPKDLIVAHETNQFLAYESITRAHTGDPNVLISRGRTEGELALYGHGFYTQVGREGARGTGLTIRFHIDPQAREGKDFTIHNNTFVVFKNKNALKVIPESLNIDPVSYFEMLASADGVDKNDLGIYEKLKRRLGRDMLNLSADQEHEILNIVRTEFSKSEPSPLLLKDWFDLPLSLRYPEIVSELIKNGKTNTDGFIAREVLSRSQWTAHPELVEMLIKKGTVDRIIEESILSKPQWKDHPELVESLIKNTKEDRFIAYHILSQPHWKDHPELVDLLFKKGTLDPYIAHAIPSQLHWKDHPEWVQALIERGARYTNKNLAKFVLSQPQWKDHPEWVQALIEKGNADPEIAEFVLSQPQWKDQPAMKQLCPMGVTLECLKEQFRRGFTFRKPKNVSPGVCIERGLKDDLF